MAPPSLIGFVSWEIDDAGSNGHNSEARGRVLATDHGEYRRYLERAIVHLPMAFSISSRYFSTQNKIYLIRSGRVGIEDGAPTNNHADRSHDTEARARWREERTTFQRVYDVISGPAGYLTAKTIGERAECSTDGARTALSQLVEMGIAERRGDRPVEYRRNESYFRWKRIEALARNRSTTDLQEEVETLIAEDRSLQERFGPPIPMRSPQPDSRAVITTRSTSSGTH